MPRPRRYPIAGPLSITHSINGRRDVGDNRPYLVIVPVLLGRGERFFDHLDGGPDGYRCVELVTPPAVAHVRLTRAPR